MSIVELREEESLSPAERLLEHSWEQRERSASQRELIVDATAAALFVAAAGALLLANGAAGLRPGLLAVLIAMYALVGRIEFAVGAGYVVPTQLILIPMLMMLPPAVVPAAVAAGLVLGNAVESLLGRVPPRRVLSALPDAWHAIGPALVLLAAGSPTIGFRQLPLIVAAFAASCAVDLSSSLIRLRLAGVVPELGLQIQVIGLVWAVDAALAPLGFIAAIASRENDVAILFVLPLVFLLSKLATDRSHRIDQAHQRLKLAEHERTRLRSAVRRLGDAFAAKLELGGLLEILLHGSVEALDAAAGRLELAHGTDPLELSTGEEEWFDGLGGGVADDGLGPAQTIVAGISSLRVPIRVPAAPREITGALRLVRSGRPFDEDEVALISELIAKAEGSAAEIIAHHAIREQAMTDSLTELGNRRRLSTDLEAAFADRTANGPSLLLLFDLDGFKEFNDAFGHPAGDALLARLGARLRRATEGRGKAYRLGGDEFCAHLSLAGVDADALILETASALSESQPEYTICASIGVVLLPHEASSPGHALQLADERMYANKRSRSTARSQAGEVLLRTMQAKQPELDRHASAVAELATRVARRLGLEGDALEDVARAAQLHDIGKVGIPDAILNKPSLLDEAEWKLIHHHTIYGERIIEGAPALRGVAGLVRASHERWDGRGYPDRLRGEEIPLGARIVSVCDAYEAMTTDRAYRPAVTHDAACGELRRCAGSQFDPMVVEAFVSVIDAGTDDGEHDPARHAAAHVRALLAVDG